MIAPKKGTIRNGFFSRVQASEVLGCTYHTIRGLQRKGVLVGQKDKDGLWWFSVQEITEAREYVKHSGKRTQGEQTARAFELFEAGASHVRCVIVLRVTTAQLRAMRAEYDRGGWCFSSQQVEALQGMLEGAALDAQSPAQLLEAVSRLCSRDAQLRRLQLASAR